MAWKEFPHSLDPERTQARIVQPRSSRSGTCFFITSQASVNSIGLSLGATFQRSPPDPAPEFGYCGKIESSQTRGMVSALSELQSRHS